MSWIICVCPLRLVVSSLTPMGLLSDGSGRTLLPSRDTASQGQEGDACWAFFFNGVLTGIDRAE